jgi:hypothetical protein
MTAEMKKRKQKLQNRLELYYECEEQILAGQSFTIGSRSLTRANLSEVTSMIKKLEDEIAAIDANGTTKRKVARIIPRDI